MKFPLRSFLVNGKKTPQLSVDLLKNFHLLKKFLTEKQLALKVNSDIKMSFNEAATVS